MRVLAIGTAIDTLRTQLDIVERPVAETILEHLTTAQVVIFVLFQIAGIEDTAQVPVVCAQRCGSA